MNYYERHIGDYLKDTAHLSLLEHGIYGRLLDVYYTREGPLPAGQVERLTGVRSKEERAALSAVLAEFFKADGDTLTHSRCDREIARYQDKQAKAKRSAEARWNERTAHTERNANAMRTHSEGNALQSPVTRHQTPDTIIGGKPPSGVKRRTQIPAEFYPDETGISKAEERGVSVAVELQKFTDYHKGKGSVMADWQAAWRTWLGNVKQAQETFKERDARNARKRWEEMTGNHHPDTVLPDILRLS